jgi:ribonuclease R
MKQQRLHVPYPIPSREEILAIIRSKKTKTIAYRTLLKECKITEENQVGFEKRFNAMQRDGQIIFEENRISLAPEDQFILGKIHANRNGFGFLCRDDGLTEDIFVSEIEMQKVMHGDKVRVRLSPRQGKKPEGVIVEVVERAVQKIIGKAHLQQDKWFVTPNDSRLVQAIEVILTPESQVHYLQLEEGVLVELQITTPPTRYTDPKGELLEIIGHEDDSGIEIEIATRQFNIPLEFSEKTIAEVSKLSDELQAEDYQHRVDLRDIPFVTIDGEDARDFDDAVYAQPDFTSGKRTGWRLLVAIADVSHYVKPDTALDGDAIERATSVYFPRRVIPMLPEKLSNGLCSLNPHVDRLALVSDIVIQDNGEVKGYQFYPAVIHSHCRYTYNQVWELIQQHQENELNATEKTENKKTNASAKKAKGENNSNNLNNANNLNSDVVIAEQNNFNNSRQFKANPDIRAIPLTQTHYDCVPHILNLKGVYETLLQQRDKRHALDFEVEESKAVIGVGGKIEKIIGLKRNEAHKIIEEAMLVANVCAADFMNRSKHTGLYRIHEGPNPTKLPALRVFLKSQGIELTEEPTTGEYHQALSALMKRENGQHLQTLMLRAMQQARYCPENIGHFGLAYEAYAHFTSPIRRYPDLTVHRVIKALIHKKRIEFPMEDWERLGNHCSDLERRADEASKEVMNWLKCQFMKQHLGEKVQGFISGVAPFGMMVMMREFNVEGVVALQSLSGKERFQVLDYALRGEKTGKLYQMGAPIWVQVAGIDESRRRVELVLCDQDGAIHSVNNTHKNEHGKNHTTTHAPAHTQQPQAEEVKEGVDSSTSASRNRRRRQRNRNRNKTKTVIE